MSLSISFSFDISSSSVSVAGSGSQVGAEELFSETTFTSGTVSQPIDTVWWNFETMVDEFTVSPRGIFLNQSKYALEIIKKYGMETNDPVDTPMVEKSKLDEDPQGKAIDPTRYRGMIGSLMYLTSC
ncbi:uncharacterized mitochondrial protein-like protein [Tanacetum coccineum]